MKIIMLYRSKDLLPDAIQHGMLSNCLRLHVVISVSYTHLDVYKRQNLYWNTYLTDTEAYEDRTELITVN